MEPVLNLNNEVVKMRKDVKRVKVLTIRKLTRHIAKLKSKKGTEELKLKNQRRAQRLLEEIHTIKALKPDDVTKTALRKEINFDKVFNKADSTAETRAITRLATNPVLKQKISAIKDAIKAFKEARKNLVEREGEDGEIRKSSKPVQNVSTQAANKCKQETAKLDQTSEERNNKKESLDNIGILGKVPDFIDRLQSHEEDDGCSRKTVLEKLSQTVQEVSAKEKTMGSVPENQAFKKTCEKKAVEMTSEKKVVEGISGKKEGISQKNTIKGICEKKDTAVQVSYIEDSEEAKKYLDCIMDQQLSDSDNGDILDDSDTDSDDDSLIEKTDSIAETRAITRKVLNKLRKQRISIQALINDLSEDEKNVVKGEGEDGQAESTAESQSIATSPLHARSDLSDLIGRVRKKTDVLDTVQDFDRVPSQEEDDGCPKNAAPKKLLRTIQEVSTEEKTAESVPEKKAFKKRCEKKGIKGIFGNKAAESISGKEAVEGISGKEALEDTCGKKTTSVQDNDTSDIEDSDKEDKEYFDDSTEERFYKQPSDFDDSDSDSEDDFFIGKVRQTKKRKSNKICSDKKIKKDIVQPESTKSTASSTVQQKEKVAPKTVKLESVFCKSLSETKPKSPYMKRDAVSNAPSYKESQAAPKMVSRGPGYLEHKSPPVRNKKSAAPQSRTMIQKHQPVRGAVVKPQSNLQEQTLHPSWEASRKRKAQSQIAVFQGKKIVFDD